MGIVLFLITRQVLTLAFVLLSPVMLAWNAIEDRVRGNRQRAADLVAFRDALARSGASVASAFERAIEWRHATQPGPAVATAWAVGTSPRIWQRRPEHGDFLAVRVGLADQPSLIDVEAPQGGDAGLGAETEALASAYAVEPGVPAVIELRDAGLVGLVGSEEPARELARSSSCSLPSMPTDGSGPSGSRTRAASRPTPARSPATSARRPRCWSCWSRWWRTGASRPATSSAAPATGCRTSS
jgi:S-DNA-T family DNA segregation ATPase FtsK/SpoIIIE